VFCQFQFVGYFLLTHCIWQILLIKKNQKVQFPVWILDSGVFDHQIQLIPRFVYAFSVVGVDDEDDGVEVLHVMPP